MKNEEFLARLEAALRDKMPAEEIEDVLAYHREYFAEAGEDAAAKLDPPEIIAQRVLDEYFAPPEKSRRKPTIKAAVLILIAVAIAAVVGIAAQKQLWRMAGARLVNRWTTVERVDIASGDSIVWPITLKEEAISEVTYFGPAKDGVFVKTDPDIFHTIYVDVGVADVILRWGDCWQFLWSNTVADAFTYEYSEADGWFQITGGEQLDRADSAEIVIVVPIPAELEIKTGVGNITATDIEADSLRLTAGVGDIRVERSQAADELNCETRIGNIDVSGDFDCDVTLVSGVGNVATHGLAAPASRYSITLEGALGDFSVDGKKVRGDYQTGEGDNAFLVKAGLGNITLDF